jgi:hypothetical protein
MHGNSGIVVLLCDYGICTILRDRLKQRVLKTTFRDRLKQRVYTMAYKPRYYGEYAILFWLI